LIFNNFKVFKRYNNADSYALAVGLSGDAFTGKKVPVAVWPTDIEPLTVAEIKILQVSLNSRGFDAGVVDGIPGRKTRTALQGFQKSQGVVADGYPTKDMLTLLTRRICSRCLDQLIRGPFPDRIRPRHRAGRNRRRTPMKISRPEAIMNGNVRADILVDEEAEERRHDIAIPFAEMTRPATLPCSWATPRAKHRWKSPAGQAPARVPAGTAP
jgi:hypothetical protein